MNENTWINWWDSIANEKPKWRRYIKNIWKYRRVWKYMILLWEDECEKHGAVTLEPGESITIAVEYDEKTEDTKTGQKLMLD